MVVGLQYQQITLTHYLRNDTDPFLSETTPTTRQLTVLIQRLDGAEDSNTLQTTETLQSIKVHVRDPKQPNATAGDTFTYSGYEWVITQVSTTLMDNNAVTYLPLYWVFTAKRRQGRGN